MAGKVRVCSCVPPPHATAAPAAVEHAVQAAESSHAVAPDPAVRVAALARPGHAAGARQRGRTWKRWMAGVVRLSKKSEPVR